MVQKYIYHHLGLGDHIICNGMVRHFSELYDQITLFCYSHYFDNIKYMFRDLKNLTILHFKKEYEIIDYIIKNNLQKDLIKIGFENLQQYLNDITFDKAFYKLAGLDFDIRFSKFYFERDYFREKNLIKSLNPTGEPYVFIHDDPDRGYNIHVKTNYNIIRNNKKFLLFDYIGLLENAEQIHLMQSSFKDMINSYKMPKPKIYQHNYIRNYPNSIHSIGLNNIEEIN